jgi:hypothetical protein
VIIPKPQKRLRVALFPVTREALKSFSRILQKVACTPFWFGV